jgi:hypothetical protein
MLSPPRRPTTSIIHGAERDITKASPTGDAFASSQAHDDNFFHRCDCRPVRLSCSAQLYRWQLGTTCQAPSRDRTKPKTALAKAGLPKMPG